VVIIGAGFGGLAAAQALARAPAAVTVVDRRNHHLFQPLLYQVATAALDASHIASPVRTVLRRSRNTEVLLGEVLSVDQERRVLHLDGASLGYDWLIVASGAEDAYFGHPDWAMSAPGLKSIEDALEIRRRVLLAFERAETSDDPQERAALMTFVLVGGGPTGVELAGALSEIAQHALRKDFRRIDTRRARIVLVEALPQLLPSYPAHLAASARATLERLGIEVRTGERVTAIDPAGVQMGEERIPARTVLWGAGVTASPLGARLTAERDRTGRVRVAPTLALPGDERVFVVGDLALVETGGRAVPGVAPAAQQMGTHAARNVLRSMRGQPLLPFHYRDRGTFAVIGRGAAVGVLGRRLGMSGFPAWLAWLGIHLLFLVGFRNRIAVLFSWAYSYLTYRRVARLITFPWKPSPGSAPGPASVAPREPVPARASPPA
jgi:NADH dehydrogenase